MFDLKILGGTVVDGTGAERFTGDIGITGGRIVEVRRRGPGDTPLDGAAAETIDATGKVVAPGFVDIHTHYDGQVSWDDVLEPSTNHGVTTVISGNCGVGFAPVRPGSEDWLIALMEGVEDIPGTALSEGITWGWESFPEYLDVIERMPRAIDIGAQVPHGPVRAYVMGERAHEEPDADEIARMAELTAEALRAPLPPLPNLPPLPPKAEMAPPPSALPSEPKPEPTPAPLAAAPAASQVPPPAAAPPPVDAFEEELRRILGRAPQKG